MKIKSIFLIIFTTKVVKTSKFRFGPPEIRFWPVLETPKTDFGPIWPEFAEEPRRTCRFWTDFGPLWTDQNRTEAAETDQKPTRNWPEIRHFDQTSFAEVEIRRPRFGQILRFFEKCQNLIKFGPEIVKYFRPRPKPPKIDQKFAGNSALSRPKSKKQLRWLKKLEAPKSPLNLF